MAETAWKLLLVEDNPGDARLIPEMLRLAGGAEVEVRVATRLAEARAAAAGAEVVLLDLDLPDSTGLATVTEMLRAAPHLPVIVLTGLSDEETGVRAVQAGAQDYLVKGEISGELLIRAIRYALERKRLYAAAERATRHRDEILSVVAHDLRNPLAAISSYASLLDRPLPDEQRERYLAAIFHATDRMDRLIQDLLDASRLDAGQLRMERRAEPLRPLLDEAVEAVQREASERGVRLELTAGDALPPATLDRHRILQALGNLLDNAIRFTAPGGRVALRAEALEREVLLLVADEGPGVEQEHLPHLFDRFWQARTTHRAGAGLGLAIAKGIVEAHGGRIGVESRPGSGSVFFLALPREEHAPPAEAAPEQTEADPAAAASGDPLRVLVVDDHPAVRRGFAECLRQAGGFEVAGEAGSGEEALEQARIRHPDLVVMDLTMPGIGGLEAIRRLTAAQHEVRVVAVTAEPEAEALLPALDAGAHGFVRKATAHRDLPAALRAAARDEVFLYPSGSRLLLRDYLEAEDEDPRLRELSEHERDILALAAEGYTSTEIGKRLFLSPKTVDSYRSRAMRALGLAHRTELVRFALRTGLLAAAQSPAPGRS